MSKIVSVVYHSGYGHTAKVAEAVASGAKVDGITVNLLKADALSDADWTTLDGSDAIIFGAPTYMGGVSAQFKTFIDATSKRWFTQAWKDKIAAGFTNSGNYSGDKLASLQQLMLLGMQHGMIWVGQAEMSPTYADKEPNSFDAINRLGSNSGLMTQSNHKAGPDTAPPAGDLETARRFGKRVAEVTKRFN
ncbi:MAG: flavodoxin family protein [Rickettsiales bacterium]|nr:flavodoxin family protein [Rickettsiales bacterium]